MQKSIYHPNGSIGIAATPSAGIQSTAEMAAVNMHRQRKMRRMAPLLLAGCLALALMSVLFVPLLVDGASASASAAPAVTAPAQQNIAEFSTLQEAADVLGFMPVWPSSLPQDFRVTNYRVVDGTMLEIVYSSPKESVTFRMAQGNDDLSGMDKEYAYTVTETVDGITRSYAGVSAQKLNFAVWADDTFSYAVVSSAGMDAEQFRALAESVA